MILQSLKSWTDGLVATIVKEAEALLNAKDAIQKMRSLEPTFKESYLVAAKNCQKGMYQCAVYGDHVSCSCPCYKYNNLCKHSICAAEIVGILKEHLDFLKTSPRRKAPARSDLLQPAKAAQGKKGGRNKNPWPPNRRPSQETAQRTTSGRPFTEVHHNNKPFFLCFLDDVPNAKEFNAGNAA